MARTFRTKRQTHPIAELNVTNLIDLGFMLLIIFMLTTSASKQEQTIPMNLPVESKSAQQNPDSDVRFVVVSVDAQGSYHLENNPAPIALPELRERLRIYAGEPKPPVMRIRGDGDVSYSKMVQLVDELKQANLLKLTFDTQIKG
jgi:biopolymer transport protein ExbD